MPHYMLLLRENPATFQDYSPERFQKLIEAFDAWSARLAREGRLLGGHKLTDNAGRVLTKPGPKLLAKDGPYVETKEVMGGYYLIKADSYEHAVQLCQEHPTFLYGGSVEIRQVDYMGQPEP